VHSSTSWSKVHTTVGFDILSKAKLPWPIADVALSHHERLDGSGYPNGLFGEEIILPARIIAVADVVAACVAVFDTGFTFDAS
jgi:HD-GYP domain-containing protein (c-di-GMP phosphodiesterase class II)